MPNAFGGRFGFDVDARHSFPQDVLATITLVGGRAGDGEARAGIGHEAGLPLCSAAITALLGVVTDPKLLESGTSWLCPLKVFFPLSELGFLLQRDRMQEQLGPTQPLSLGWLHTEVEAVSTCTARTGVFFPLALLTCNIRHTSPLSLPACHCPQFLPHLPCCASAWPVWTLHVLWVSCTIASAVSDQGSFRYSE